MGDSFFTIPKSRTRKANERKTAPKVTRKSSGPKQQDSDHDLSMSSSSESGIEHEEDMQIDSESEHEQESEADRRRRLAKQYLENIKAEIQEEEGVEGFDAADLDRDIIASRLKEDVAENQGTMYRYIGAAMESASWSHRAKMSTDFFAATSLAVSSNAVFVTFKDGTLVKLERRPKGKLFITKIARRAKRPPRGVDVREFTKSQKVGHWDEILCVATSPDGKYVVTGGRDRRIVVRSCATLSLVKVFDTRDRKGVVTGLAFKRGTNNLYVSCEDLKVRIYNLDQFTYVETLFGHQDKVLDISALGQERCLTVGSRDRTAVLWKIADESRLTFRGDSNKGDFLEGSIDCCCMVDDNLFVTGSDNGSVSLWSVHKKKPIYVARISHGLNQQRSSDQSTADTESTWAPSPLPRYVTAIKAIPYSDVVITGSTSGELLIWQIQDKRKLRNIGKIPGFKGVVNRIDVVESGSRKQRTIVVYAAVSKEHRLGRWLREPEFNGVISCETVIST